MNKLGVTFTLVFGSLIMANQAVAQVSCNKVFIESFNANLNFQAKSIVERIAANSQSSDLTFLALLKRNLDAIETPAMERVLAHLLTDKVIRAQHGTTPILDLVIQSFLERKDKVSQPASQDGFVISDVYSSNSLIGLALFSYNPKLAADLLATGYPANGVIKFHDLEKFGFSKRALRYPFHEMDDKAFVSNLVVASLLGYNKTVALLLEQGAQPLYLLTRFVSEWTEVKTTYSSEIAIIKQFGKSEAAELILQKFPKGALAVDFNSEGSLHPATGNRYLPNYDSRRYESFWDFIQGIETVDMVRVTQPQKGFAYPVYRSNWSGNNQYPAPALSFREVVRATSDSGL